MRAPPTLQCEALRRRPWLASTDPGTDIARIQPAGVGRPRRDGDQYDAGVVRSAGDLPPNPAVVVLNPEDEVTPEAFFAWLDRWQTGQPVDPGVTAAETLAEVRAAGEA